MTELFADRPNLRRVVMIGYFDVHDGNPNGDPSNGNHPRYDEYTGQGEVSDVSVKRHLRDAFADLGHEIFIEKGIPLATKKRAVMEVVAPDLDFSSLDEAPAAPTGEDTDAPTPKGRKSSKKSKTEVTPEQIAEARRVICSRFIDMRLFGATLGANKENLLKLENIRGCTNISFSRSVNAIQVRDHQIVRTTTENDKVARGESSMNQTFGQKPLVCYGLYQMMVIFDLKEARANGVSQEDFDLLVEQLVGLYQNRPSAARGPQIGMQALYAFYVEATGVAALSATQCRSFVKAEQRTDGVARSFQDFRISVAEKSLPSSVTLETIVKPIFTDELKFAA